MSFRNKPLQFAVVLFSLAIASSAHSGATPEQKCESAKNKTVGKYVGCLQKARSKFVSTGLVDLDTFNAAFTVCGDKYSIAWGKIEEKAGTMVCPSEGDETSIQDFIDSSVLSVQEALHGGDLPSDAVSCNEDLTTCESDLSSTNSDLSDCNSALAVYTAPAPNPVLWLRADAGVTADPGNLVSVWADQSGNGYDAQQGSMALQPTVVPNVQAGLPVLRFANNPYMTIPYNSELNLTTGLDIFVVFNVASFANLHATLICMGDTSWRFQRLTSTNSMRFGTGMAPAFHDLDGTSSVNDATFHLGEISYDGATKRLTIDGTTEGLAAVPSAVPVVSYPLSIGENLELSGRKWDGDIAEILIYDHELTLSERASVTAYLAGKWGL